MTNRIVFTRIFRGVMLCALLVLLTQCSTQQRVERRIQRNPEMFAALSAEDQALVRAGRLREGMHKDGVFLALGPPDRVTVGRQRARDYERWIYIGQRPVMMNTVGMGWGGFGSWGYGAYHGGPFYDPFYMGGGGVAYVPYDAASVDFSGGKVSGWQMPRSAMTP